MTNLIKIGIVGLGYWGPNLLRNFSQTESCQVKYGCDQNNNIFKKLAKQYPGIKFTNNYNELINDNNLDAVAIATPVFTHYQLAKQALERGKHVLLEKPMASSIQECEELIEIAKQNNLILMIDHTFLYTSAVRKIKEIISKDELGDIYYFDSERINLGLIQNDVNVIWDLAPHDISIANYLFKDAEPTSIFCAGNNHINKKEEMAHITINYSNGIVGHIHCSWLSPIKIRKILIGGSKKMILYNDIDPLEKVKIYDKNISVDINKETPSTPIYRGGDIYIPRLDIYEALRAECEHFLDCIQNAKPPFVDGTAGLEVVKILEACDRSLKEEKKIIL